MLSARSKFTKLSSSLRFASTYSSEKMVRKYPVGAKVHGFEIQRVKAVPEFSMTAVELAHLKTGGKHLHIDRDDKNNVFSVSFKTNPPDSTGVPHILEHTTLCGSEKYPVRDPFFKMLNRSLSNFMNAMTGHDYTFFPFATTNKKDYDNLTDIYLDSTFMPLLKESDFQQEGWRLENEITEDRNSPLIFKGVVYNEMKGQVSNSSYYYWIKFQESIYPSLNNSGGDPTKITNLQYWDLIDFQSANYHPSNCRSFTYGSFPLVSSLQKLDEKFTTFGKRLPRNVIKKPIELKESKSIVIPGPIDPMLLQDKQFKSSVTWYVGDPKDTYHTFLMKILSNLLIDGHSAPLYQHLIESGVGSDFSVNTGMESITAMNMFTVGLQGLSELNSDNLPSLITEILKRTSEKGFDKKRIDAILHQLELSKKIHSAEFGMNLLYAVTPLWINDIDPFDMLSFEATISKFREEYLSKGDKIFTDFIQEYLIHKPTFTFTMKPDAEFQNNLVLEEQERLEAKTQHLSDEEKQLLFERGLDLQAKQNETEDLSSLPTLHIDDIPTRGDSFRVDVSSGEVPVYKRVSPKANGLTYFRAIKDITSCIPIELIPYLPLFTECLTNLGTHSKEMSELGEEIKLFTGGLSASVGVSSTAFNINEAVLSFSLSGVALNQNVDKMFELFNQLLLDTNFENKEKLTILIKALNSDNLNSIISSGHSFAKSYSTAQFSEKAAYDELLNGIKQVQILNDFEKWSDQDLLLEKVIPKLKNLQEILVNNKNFRVAIVCDPEIQQQNEIASNKFISNLPNSDIDKQVSRLIIPTTDTKFKNYIKVPTQVQFSSLSLPGVSYSNRDGASLQVLSQLLTFKRLHKEIREKGGAYGGGSNYDALNGIFNFYSYRDPNPFRSLREFQSTGNYISENVTSNFTDSIVALAEDQASAEGITVKDLDQAKLTIFQRIDAPIGVRDEGMSLFVHGIDNDLKQERRENILGVSLDDIRDVSDRYLLGSSTESACIIGSGDNAELKDEWNVVEIGEASNHI